jgi:hypothetical protein
MAKGRCLWGIQHWRELLSESEVILELLNDTVTPAPALPKRSCAVW